MSRRTILVSLMALVIASVSMAGDAAWFDMDNCAMCKNLASNPELMMNMEWEQYNISNGIVSICTVGDEYLDAYRAAHKEMEAVGARMMKGEKVDMCGSCTAFGECIAMGVKPEWVMTEHGDMMIATSDNPDAVKKLQKWAARNKEEMKKMETGG